MNDVAKLEDISRYSIVRIDGLWLIGIVDGRVLRNALAIDIKAGIEGGNLQVQYSTFPIFGMAEQDEYPLNAAKEYPVADMPEYRQRMIGESVKMAEGIRRQMLMQAGTSLHLATSMPKGMVRS
jgi:hypothetical protein